MARRIGSLLALVIGASLTASCGLPFYPGKPQGPASNQEKATTSGGGGNQSDGPY
jgi:hypothetical protein